MKNGQQAKNYFRGCSVVVAEIGNVFSNVLLSFPILKFLQK